MMKVLTKIGYLVVGLALLLSACKNQAPAETSTPGDLAPIFTAAAATADARVTHTLGAAQNAAATRQATGTPGNAPLQPGQTPQTASQLPATANPVIVPAQGTPNTSASTGKGDAAEFMSDVSIPDNTSLKAGESFVKTWRIKNNGASTWNNTFVLYFASGEQMGAPDSVPVPTTVAPGQTVDISVPMTAPGKGGTHVGLWMLRNTEKKAFGVGTGANEPIYVQIVVGGDAAAVEGTPGAAAAITPSPTPIKTSGNIIQSASLGVDKDMVNGCPHTYTFMVQFTLKKPATVTYRFEAETNMALKLPEPATVNLGAGTHSLVYTLNFSTPVNGWARLHFTAPEEIVSNKVNFTLTCK